jgi:hypothetical protein
VVGEKDFVAGREPGGREDRIAPCRGIVEKDEVLRLCTDGGRHGRRGRPYGRLQFSGHELRGCGFHAAAPVVLPREDFQRRGSV